MKCTPTFAVSVATVLLALSSPFACKEPPSIGEGPIGPGSSAGGSSGAPGTSNPSRDDASASSQGGSGSPTTWTINFDAKLGEPDLPEEASTPTGDLNCGEVSRKTKRQPVDVLLVLDRSSSMDYSIADVCYCNSADVAGGFGTICKDAANCTTRWNAIKGAMKTTLANSTNVNWGLKFFMSPDPTLAQCTVTKDMEVKIGSEKASENIQSAIENATKSMSTPTAAAVNAAVDYLKTVDDSNKKFILLATDGEPNCGPGPTRNPAPSINNADVPGATAAMTAAKAAGFTAYVVGIGPETSNLSKLAQAGGDRDYFPAGSADELSKALSSISTIVASCVFSSENSPDDPNNVAVYVNKQLVPKSDSEGWKYGTTDKDIELTGKYCQDIQAGLDTDVQILFGCKGETYFPPTIL